MAESGGGRVRVLIVDDSVVYRSQIKNALTDIPGIEIVGVAPNGSVALKKMAQNPVDLLILDMEMPEMDGLATLQEIQNQKILVNVLVFTAQSQHSIHRTFDALKSGAADFITKPSGDVLNFEQAMEDIRSQLVPKVRQFVKAPKQEIAAAGVKKIVSKRSVFEILQSRPQAVVIASSTGDPTALETVFAKFDKPLEYPILIAQHMPANFTKILAEKIGRLSGLVGVEAQGGQEVLPGHVYVVPGDFHGKLFVSENGVVRIGLDQGPRRNSVRPCADYLFESAAEIYREKLLGIVLTGMGEDGRDGSLAIKEKGGTVIIQNEESCTVWGMPRAVYEADCYDRIDTLEDIRDTLTKVSA